MRDRDLKRISRSAKGLPSKLEQREKINQQTCQKVCCILEIFNQTDTSTDSLLKFQNSFPAVHGAKQIHKLVDGTPSSMECFTTHRYTQTFTV